jgi:hypothetical protein
MRRSKMPNGAGLRVLSWDPLSLGLPICLADNMVLYPEIVLRLLVRQKYVIRTDCHRETVSWEGAGCKYVWDLSSYNI